MYFSWNMCMCFVVCFMCIKPVFMFNIHSYVVYIYLEYTLKVRINNVKFKKWHEYNILNCAVKKLQIETIFYLKQCPLAYDVNFLKTM